jgi:NAD(P)-dependent dehydrogenase (short-subunit alcohol dehydrogenase family)
MEKANQKKASAARKENTEEELEPRPQSNASGYSPGDKLRGKVALITGGDSGIGRATAIHYAKEGADVVIVYRKEKKDAEKTCELVQAEGRKCIAVSGDVSEESFSSQVIRKVKDEFGKLDILVNNAAEQHPQKDFEEISAEQLEETFRTNIFGYFYFARAALPLLIESKGVIINTASVTAYRGSPELVDYSATKGAIVAFTRSLSKSLAAKGVRVNGVAPGPIWTPLISSTFPPDKAANFGKDVPMGRPGQPDEVAPSFVFLASDDSSYMTGQFLHPNGGEIVNA